MSQAADIIIIGGGAAGCSAAMQLSLRGRRVLVLERALLGSGSTGRAAGLGAQLRESPDETRLLMKGIEVVKDIEKRVKKKIFTGTGSLHVASDPERAGELRSFVKMGKEIGFEIDLVNADFAGRLLPCMRSGTAAPASPSRVGARSRLSAIGASVTPRCAAGARGSKTRSGTRIDSSWINHLPAKPRSPRK